MFKLFKKPLFIILIIIVIALIGGTFYFSRGKKPQYETAIIQRGNLTEEVSVTGRVKPAEEVDLAFEKTSRVNRINVSVNDKVLSGQSLVELDSSELYAQLKQNEAALQTQQAKLDELKKGSRVEDIRIKESELQKAEQDLTNYYRDVPRIISDAYGKSDDAIRNKTNDLFNNDDTIPYLTFITDYQTEIDLESTRLSLNKELKDWLEEVNLASDVSSQADLDKALSNAETRLITVRDFLNQSMYAVSKSTSLSASTMSSYNDNITAGRTNINVALSGVIAQKQNIASQKITIQKVQNELNLKLAGSAPEAISAQEAQVEQAEAAVQLVKIQISKNILRSPINGTVTKQDAKIGQIVAANSPIVSVISQNKLEIEANVAEADIAKVQINDPANITLDAFSNDVVFEAKVVKIDPAETVIEGVATYKTTLMFIKEDERVKPGMTANIDIISDRRENVIVAPQRAVITKDGNRFIRILTDRNQIEEVKVKTGLRGSDGNVEIIEGLNEGDKIVVFMQEE